MDAKNGRVFVEVLDARGQPIPGFSQSEARAFEGVDELRLQPKWRAHADLTALKGQIIRLRFHLTNARLYAFQVKPQVGQWEKEAS